MVTAVVKCTPSEETLIGGFKIAQ